jgi:hypothetical protein
MPVKTTDTTQTRTPGHWPPPCSTFQADIRAIPDLWCTTGMGNKLCKQKKMSKKAVVRAGQVSIEENGVPCFCPYAPPLVIPNPLNPGQANVQRLPCSSMCALFVLFQDRVCLSCSGQIYEFGINLPDAAAGPNGNN